MSVACYSGGLIDDLSDDGERPRIIMTSANETRTSKRGVPPDWFNPWSECFIEALHGEEVDWDDEEHCLIHTGVTVDADWSNDENVSMWEAWDYAWKNDYWRQNGYETPWLDDNGNDLPNYKEGSDMLDSCDGLLSMETYFGSGNLKSADVNDDATVNIKDQAIVAKAYGSYLGHPNWNPDADLNNDNKVNTIDIAFVAKHLGKWYPSGSGSKGEEASSDLLEGVTSLYLHPDEIKVHKNEVFSVDVNVTGVTDLYAYEFKIYYDKTVLSCVDVNLPGEHFLEPINDLNNIYIAKMEYDNAYNATHGRVWVAVTLLGDEPGKNGDGTLVTITFTAKTKGKPIITLQDIILVQAKSLNFHTGPSTPP